MSENRLKGKYRFLPADIPLRPTNTYLRLLARGRAKGELPFPRAMRRISKRRAGRRGWREYNKLVRLAQKHGFAL